MEVKKYFSSPSTSVTPAQHHQLPSQPQEASLDKEGTLSSFLQSCLKLLRNQDDLNELQKFIASCRPPQSYGRDKPLQRISRTGREMRLNAQIGAYDMTDVILDLGSDVNVLTKQTWEQMGKPALAWSPIQLRLANQQRIVPLGRFLSVQIDIDGFSTFSDFEVIEIIDDSNPYPSLLGIEWAMENAAVINLKKRQMIFEGKDLRVIIPR